MLNTSEFDLLLHALSKNLSLAERRDAEDIIAEYGKISAAYQDAFHRNRVYRLQSLVAE